MALGHGATGHVRARYRNDQGTLTVTSGSLDAHDQFIRISTSSRAAPYRSSKLGISGYHRIVPPDRAWVLLTLERRIDEGVADEEDVMIYEIITDPEVQMAEKQRRSREGQYQRRIRHRADRARNDPGR